MKKILLIILSFLFLAGCSTTAITIDENLVCDPINESDCVTVSNGKMDIIQNDQTTPTIIFPLYEVVNSGFTLANNTVPDTRNITLTSIVGFSVGDIIGIFQDTSDIRNYFGTIISINGNTLTLDTEFESVFDIAKNPIIQEIETNINEDGSTNRIIHEFRNYGTIPMDITRFIFSMETTNAVDLNKFGDIPGGLLVGCLLREQKADGTYANLYNFKSNIDFVGVNLDFETFAASHPNQGINGLASRLTLGGQDKLGVVVRLSFNESIQMVCHDDLTSLVRFNTILEGHLTNEPVSN